MRKFYSALLPLIVISILQIRNTAAQHEYDVWYFGGNAGMDFTSGLPVNLTNGKVNTVEGSASISDSSGNLLFYTDGVSVWNKLHNVMTNGNGLNGGASSSQSALILQQPGSDSLYYIFTVGEAQTNGLQYSIVDMSLQSGDGEVVVKNVLLLSNTTEKLTATFHSNGTDYWIITHQMNNKKYDAYLFDATGVNVTPVESNLGALHNSEVGYMKCSHSGSRIAVAVHSPGNFFELSDFDKSTGIVSNPVFFAAPPSAFGGYGIEFSPNDSILYGSVYTPGILVQWDLSSNNDSIIKASQVSLDTSTNIYLFAMQLANDGKIYIAKYLDPYLAVINDPNVYGSGCNFVDNGFDLSPKQSQAGLPNCFPGFFAANIFPSAQFTVSSAQGCINTCVDFTDQSLNGPTSWQWSFPGANPSSSTDQNPANICYASSGSFDVTLIVSNASGSDTILLPSYITILPPPAVTISQINDTLFATLAQSYQWFFDGYAIAGDTQAITINQTGEYIVVVTDSSGCFASDTFIVTNISSPGFSVNDTSVCEKFCIDFTDQSTNNPTTWQWFFPGGNPASSNDQNPASVCYATPGTYDVTLITTNANGNDTLTLSNYITVIPTPAAPIISQAGYTLTSTSSISYQWQLNSVDIPGATNQSYTVLQSGLYTVVVSDLNGCKNSSSVDILISGIDEVQDDANIFIAPNPSNGNFSIELMNDFNNDHVSVNVLNALGQKVFTSVDKFSGIKWKKDIDLVDLARGVYLIQVKTNNNSWVKILIIEH
jgi:PKD repeat protein